MGDFYNGGFYGDADDRVQIVFYNSAGLRVAYTSYQFGTLYDGITQAQHEILDNCSSGITAGRLIAGDVVGPVSYAYVRSAISGITEVITPNEPPFM